MVEGQKSKLILLDIDGTILPGGVGIFGIAQELANQGVIMGRVPEEMNRVKSDYHDGKIPYVRHSELVLQALAAGLEGVQESSVHEATGRFLDQSRELIYPFAFSLVHGLRQTHDTFLITANAHFYGEYFKKLLGAQGTTGTIFETDDKRTFTGNISKLLTTPEAKQAEIAALLASHSRIGSIAAGDAEADKYMLAAVEIPVCVNPNTALRAEAEKNGWPIVTPDQVEGIVYQRLGIAN